MPVEEFTTRFSLWLLATKEHRFSPPKPFLRIPHNLPVSLPLGFSFAHWLGFRTKTGKAKAKAEKQWATFFQDSDEAKRVFLHYLTYNLADPNALRVNPGKNARFEYWQIINNGDEPLGFVSRKIDLSKKEVTHKIMAITKKYQSWAQGTQIFANGIALYRYLEIQHVKIKAGLSVGGAVWAKFGFRPTERAWRSVKRHVRDRFKSLPSVELQAIEAKKIPLESIVDAALGQSDPKAIWLIQDLDKLHKVRISAGKLIGIGAWLLQGSEWEGILDLSDKASNQRCQDYVEAKLRAKPLILEA